MNHASSHGHLDKEPKLRRGLLQVMPMSSCCYVGSSQPDAYAAGSAQCTSQHARTAQQDMQQSWLNPT